MTDIQTRAAFWLAGSYPDAGDVRDLPSVDGRSGSYTSTLIPVGRVSLPDDVAKLIVKQGYACAIKEG